MSGKAKRAFYAEKRWQSMRLRKSVFRSLAMISQVGISIMTPIFLCAYIGYRIDLMMGTRWIILPMLILGVLSGGRCAWQLVKRVMEEERREADELRREEMSGIAPNAGTSRPKQPSRIRRGEQEEH
jgi:ATP synthase protein I